MMADSEYDNTLSRLRTDYHEGAMVLQNVEAKGDRLLEEVTSASQHMLVEAQSRSKALEQELDEMKSAYLRSSDLQSLREPELVQVLAKFGGQDVVLLHEDIKALQTDLQKVEHEIDEKQRAIARAEAVAEQTRQSVESDLMPLEKLQIQLQVKEEKLRTQIQAEGRQNEVLDFFSAQTQLIKRQETLEQELHDNEQLLLALRQDICSIDVNASNFNDSERENAKLYVEWKEILQQKIEQYITFRQSQYELLMHINGRRETLHIITDLLTEFKTEKLHAEEANVKRKVEETEQRIEMMTSGLDKTQEAIDGFRVEFEQMRVAIMLDKATKSTQVSKMRRERDHLRKTDEYFAKLFEEEKKKVCQEMDAVWSRRFAAIQKEVGRCVCRLCQPDGMGWEGGGSGV